MLNKKILGIAILVLLTGMILTGAAAAASDESLIEIPEEVLVNPSLAEVSSDESLVYTDAVLSSLDQGTAAGVKLCVAERLLIQCTDTAEGDAVAESVTVLKDYRDIVPGLLLIAVPEGMSVAEGVVYYSNMPGVEYAEPDYVTEIEDYPVKEFDAGSVDTLSLSDSITNDPYIGKKWDLEQMSLPAAWKTTTGSSDVVVAVMDTGIRYDHEDLEDNMWRDSSGNYGYDFVNNDSDPMDDYGHGTHVAGIIGAVGNNGKGVSGVVQDVSLMAVKVGSKEGYISQSWELSGISYAVNNGADIINMSFGGYGSSSSVKSAIDWAGENGVLVVCSAGNESNNNDTNPMYPASYTSSNIISVAATDYYSALSSYSNYGKTSVDVGAPGGDSESWNNTIYSTYYNTSSSYGYMEGTSMAAPQVAGLAALLLSADPTLSVSELKSAIMNSVTAVSSLKNKTVSGGIVNAASAIGEITGERKVTSITVTGSSEVTTGSSVLLTATVLPTNATDKTVTWSSSDTSVATVDENGLVTGVNVGTVVITAKAVDGSGVTGTKNISVTAPEVKVTSITITGPSTVKAGYSIVLTATVLPSDATDKSVTWNSSNTSVATVDSNGKVTGVKAGSVTITVSAKDGSGVTGTYHVTVSYPTTVIITGDDSCQVGSSVTLKATVNGSSSTKVTWDSSDTGVATVTSAGKVTGKKAGNVTITATADDGSVGEHAMTITPKIKTVEVIPSTVSLKKGATQQLSVKVTDTTGSVLSPSQYTVSWSSSSTVVATVDSTGKVTAGSKAGSATITATCGSVKGTCKVSVVVPVEEIEITSTKGYTVEAKSSLTLKATVSPSTASNKKVTWSSSDTSVATVSSSGLVKGVSAGTAVITAEAADGLGAYDIVEITVTPKIKKVEVIPSTVSLKKGATQQLSVKVTDTSGNVLSPSQYTVTWKSSSTAVATVDSNGLVTAGSKAGSATITATCGSVKGTCKVSVVVPVEEIEITSTKGYTVEAKSSLTLKATVSPSTASNKKVTWSSSDTSVATVSSSGLVKGVSAGTAVITAEAADGQGAYDIVEITVTPKIKKVEVIPSTVSLKKGATQQLSVKVTDTYGTVLDSSEYSVTWKSSSTAVATVDSNGLVTAGSKAGSATITATCGSVKGTSKVSVVVPVEKIEITSTKGYTVEAKSSLTLKATVSPSTASNRKVTWSSSDTSVATVSSSGLVKGVSAGTAVITAEAADGQGAYDIVEITVTPKIKSVKITPSSASLKIGGSEELTATVTDTDGNILDPSEYPVTWKSSSTKIATVDEDGVVTAIKTGSATITATCGSVKGTAKVVIMKA